MKYLLRRQLLAIVSLLVYAGIHLVVWFPIVAIVMGNVEQTSGLIDIAAVLAAIYSFPVGYAYLTWRLFKREQEALQWNRSVFTMIPHLVLPLFALILLLREILGTVLV